MPNSLNVKKRNTTSSKKHKSTMNQYAVHSNSSSTGTFASFSNYTFPSYISHSNLSVPLSPTSSPSPLELEIESETDHDTRSRRKDDDIISAPITSLRSHLKNSTTSSLIDEEEYENRLDPDISKDTGSQSLIINGIKVQRLKESGEIADAKKLDSFGLLKNGRDYDMNRKESKKRVNEETNVNEKLPPRKPSLVPAIFHDSFEYEEILSLPPSYINRSSGDSSTSSTTSGTFSGTYSPGERQISLPSTLSSFSIFSPLGSIVSLPPDCCEIEIKDEREDEVIEDLESLKVYSIMRKMFEVKESVAHMMLPFDNHSIPEVEHSQLSSASSISQISLQSSLPRVPSSHARGQIRHHARKIAKLQPSPSNIEPLLLPSSPSIQSLNSSGSLSIEPSQTVIDSTLQEDLPELLEIYYTKHKGRNKSLGNAIRGEDIV